MIIEGADNHPRVQQVAFLDTETGETGERRLDHSDGEVERFYRESAMMSLFNQGVTKQQVTESAF